MLFATDSTKAAMAVQSLGVHGVLDDWVAAASNSEEAGTSPQ